MGSNSVEDMIEASSGVHFSGFHMDGLESKNIEKPTTSPGAENVQKQPFIIGVAGGAASGKTTVCDMIIQQLHDQRVVLVNQDSFYHNLTEEELARVHEYNFDHPDAFDTEKLLDSIENLRHDRAVDIPNYDFKSYKSNAFPARRKLTVIKFLQVNPSDVIILEGILIFHDPRVRELMNMKIFVDTDDELMKWCYYNVDCDADVRLARRIRRDTVDKGRDIGAVLDQYSKFVKPAFDDFILPTKKYADIIIPRGGDNHVAIDLIVQHIRTKLGQHDLCKIYPNLYVIQSTFQIRGMHTLIRDSQTTKHDFVFYSDRLIRLVVEHGLGHLPFTEKQVITPTESVYTGVDFCKRCELEDVSDSSRSIGKLPSLETKLILVVRVWRMRCEHAAKVSRLAKFLFTGKVTMVSRFLIYEKLPQDISERHVLLLDPILGTGNSAVQAISLLIKKGVPESNIIFLNLISAPQGVHVVCKSFPRVKIVTSEIEIGLNEDFRVVPGMGEFGDRYFGTDDDDNLQAVAPMQLSNQSC
ncbi:hypothetical protein CXB51_000692 [Gossypium anomalum]|uniref:uridine/cytidine kinase n=1 Tax=Gossypium anomalum TaxID=47600 RepID=A0A8J5ZK90_9ROSI|nr:hypothetical protein CXB51_000692 [Gossypium anomalum]